MPNFTRAQRREINDLVTDIKAGIESGALAPDYVIEVMRAILTGDALPHHCTRPHAIDRPWPHPDVAGYEH